MSEPYREITPQNFEETRVILERTGGRILHSSSDGWGEKGEMYLFNGPGISDHKGRHYISMDLREGLHKPETGNRHYQLRIKPEPRKPVEETGYAKTHREFFEQADVNLPTVSDWYAADSFFERLDVGDYQFGIHPFFLLSTDLFFVRAQDLYIPPESGIEEPVIVGLKHIAERIILESKENAPVLNDGDIRGIVSYIMEDLDTGNAVRRNTQAGTDADAFVGI